MGLGLSVVLHAAIFVLLSMIYRHFTPDTLPFDTIDIDLSEYTVEELYRALQDVESEPTEPGDDAFQPTEFKSKITPSTKKRGLGGRLSLHPNPRPAGIAVVSPHCELVDGRCSRAMNGAEKPGDRTFRVSSGKSPETDFSSNLYIERYGDGAV